MERMLSTLRGVQDKFPNLPALLEPYEQALRARDSTVKVPPFPPFWFCIKLTILLFL